MIRGFNVPVAVTLLAILPATARCEMLLNYNFGDNNNIVDMVDPGVTATDFLAGEGLTSISYSGNASARGWNPSLSAADAISRGDYWTFTLTAGPGKSLDLASLTFDQKQGTAGPDNFQLDVNGSLAGNIQTATTNFTTKTYDLTGFTGLTAVTFRLLGWKADNNGNHAQWYIDNVAVYGALNTVYTNSAASAVPLPATLTLLATGVLPILSYRLVIGRRRRGILAEATGA